MEDDEFLIAVSPRHSVRLASEYAVWIQRAPSQDFVVRNIVRREANGMPLIAADIVIAGFETRKAFPLAAQFPLHFRKTYFPGRLRGEPHQEYDRQRQAAEILGLPPPIGFTNDSFRSCLIPGTPYSRCSPFGADPEERNLDIARKVPLATAAGLFRLLEEGFKALTALHEAGFSHADPELHNFVVCPSPLEMLLIDFESSLLREDLTADAWTKRCADDLVPLLREAVYLLCGLGPQPGPMASRAKERIRELFKRPERFEAELNDQSGPRA